MFFRKKDKNIIKNNGSTGNQESGEGQGAYYSLIIDYLPEGILVLNEKEEVFFINSQAEKFLKVERNRILNKSVLSLIPEGHFEQIVSFLERNHQDNSIKTVSLPGENIILEIRSVPLEINRIKYGNIIVLRDITREKLVESMKSEFVMVAAHQLRTPTSGVKWSLKTLLEEDIGQLNPQQKEIIEKSYITNEKVIHLINDLLNVARIEEGEFLGRIELYDMGDIIKQVVGEYQKEMEKKNIAMEFKKYRNSLPKVMVDPDKIKIAVGNLIDNAVRYTGPGGRITLSLEARGAEEIEFKIQDTGYGIPKDQQKKVFAKFFRGDNILKIETEGTGLGLFITREIVFAHGGKIWFESDENKGTTFYFTIPVKKKFGEFLDKEFY